MRYQGGSTGAQPPLFWGYFWASKTGCFGAYFLSSNKPTNGPNGVNFKPTLATAPNLPTASSTNPVTSLPQRYRVHAQRPAAAETPTTPRPIGASVVHRTVCSYSLRRSRSQTPISNLWVIIWSLRLLPPLSGFWGDSSGISSPIPRQRHEPEGQTLGKPQWGPSLWNK